MTAFLAALLLLAPAAGAQTLTTINENLATSSNTMLVDTNSNRLDVGTASYTGSVPGAVLFVGSNVVVSTGTGGSPNVVIYATGTIDLNGIQVATGTATFVGITSACASGFHISTDTYVNGILTGGSCVADGSGGGGGSSTMTITAVSDNFIGSVTGSQKNFTLSQTPANAAALTCILDGLLLSQTSDYTYTPPSTVAVTTAPAANSTGFFCNYFVNTSTLPAVFILNSSQTVGGQNTFTQAQTFSTFTYQNSLWIGTPSVGVSTLVVGGAEVWSVDGAVESSGCVVAMWWNTTMGRFVESSTSTDMGNLSGVASGVLYEACSPNTYCKVVTRGLVSVPTQSNTLISNAVGPSVTRCLNGNSAFTSGAASCGNNVCSGHMLESQTGSAGASAHAWMMGP